MATFTLNIKDTARPQLRALLTKALNPVPGLMIAGRAVSNLLKTHFRQKEKTPNALGGERTHYWLQVAQSVNAPAAIGTGTVSVNISHPSISQKIFGGTITAKRAGALTIPINPAAYGKRASVLAQSLGIKLFRVKDVLAASGADGKLTAYYVLRKSVTQRPDPTALPPSEKIRDTAEAKFEEWLGPKN